MFIVAYFPTKRKEDFTMKKKTKQINKQYRKEIRRLIDKTEDTHALCCTYTTILTHLKILAEKGGAADE